MKKILVLLLACVMLSGCTTAINKKMSSWMGHNANDLIASWGPPQQTMSDGQGGQILVYSNNVQWTTPGRAVTNATGSANTYLGNTYGSATATTTYTPPKTRGYQRQRLFWANRNGRLYRWSWKGL